MRLSIALKTGEQDEGKQALVEQLTKLDKDYEGGLLKYIANAKQLLEGSRKGTAGRSLYPA